MNKIPTTNNSRRVIFLTIIFLSTFLYSQEADENALKQANNPLANMIAFNVQNYYMSSLYGSPDQTANTAWLRFAMPTGRVLWRASLPIPTVPRGELDPKSGIGDFNIFAAYLLSAPTSSVQFGIGPLLAAPTATNELLGSGKWQLGAAAVYFNAESPRLQYGALVTWQTSIAGDENRANTNLIVFQPFSMWQLGGGTYLRTAPLWVFDLESGNYNVPFGFGIGKILKIGGTVYNIFIEPQYTILHYGIGQPEFQIYTALNMQF